MNNLISSVIFHALEAIHEEISMGLRQEMDQCPMADPIHKYLFW